MIPRRLLLIDSCRFLHTTPVAHVTHLRKPVVIGHVDNHEFHKVIKWVKPEKLKHWDPRRSLDLEPLAPIDPTWLKLEYRPFADIINELPEGHRRLFTVEFGRRMDGTQVLLQDQLAKTRRHKYDNTSLEFKVTWSTWKIRNIQDMFKQNPMSQRNSFLRRNVKELIDKRKKWLNHMRHQDYKRFEWILDMVGVIYQLKPPYTHIERKTSVNVLVNMFCNELREKKMADYKDELEKEKVPFLKMKLETLMAVRADEDSVGLPSSVDEDIHKTRKKLLEMTKEHMTINPVSIDGSNETAYKSETTTK